MKRRPKRNNHRPSKLSRFAQRLLAAWRQFDLPVADATMLVAVSGGADSTALLLGLDELRSAGKLSFEIVVAHLDHQLRKMSRSDALAVSQLAKSLGFDVVTGRRNVRKLAFETKDNLEQAARRARFEFLHKTAKRKRASHILVAHTMDDQAETIMLRLLRGSSSEGLSGMEVIRELEPGANVTIVRPLLLWARRTETTAYCRERSVNFLVDEMNDDETFARVKVRRQLLPLMETFNRRIIEGLSRTSNLLREDNAALAADAANLLRLAIRASGVPPNETDGHSLDVNVLRQATPAVRRRALRQWISQYRGDLRRIEWVHLIAVEKLLAGDKGGRTAELPDGTRVRRTKGRLELQTKKVEKGHGSL